MEKVSGIVVLWLTEFQVDPSNSCSGIVDGSLESKSLFFFANNSSTKQWEEPESSNAMNGQACLDMVVEVRERRKEFGESEVEFSHITSAALPFSGQPLDSIQTTSRTIGWCYFQWLNSPTTTPQMWWQGCLCIPSRNLVHTAYIGWMLGQLNHGW